MRIQGILTGAGCVLTVAATQGAILTYTFDGPSLLPDTIAPNASASLFLVNPGTFAPVGLIFGNPSPSAVANDWDVAPPPAAGVKRFAFLVAADPGYALDITSLSFDNYSPDPASAANGPTTYAVVLNGVLVDGPAPTSVNAWGTVTIPLAFTGPGALVQIFAWGGSSGFTAAQQGWAVDNVILDGAVIPEPGPVALLAGLGLVGFVAWRRRCGS